MSEHETRTAEMEIKLALLEDHVDQLNHTIFRQQQQLDLLQAQFRELHRQMHAENGGNALSSPHDEPPPHY